MGVTPLSVGLLGVLLGFKLRTRKCFEVRSSRCARPLFGWRRAMALRWDADRFRSSCWGFGLRSRRPRDSGADLRLKGCVERADAPMRTTSRVCGTEIFGDWMEFWSASHVFTVLLLKETNGESCLVLETTCT